MADALYTIGHSTHTAQRVIELLRLHSVTALADVRSHPHSRINPQFNRESFSEQLKACGIKYVFLGLELGARTEDSSCYREGKIQYDLLARTDVFQSGLERARQGMTTHRVALMCAEKDPLTCHRAILVCRHLVSRGVDVEHILEDGRLETHEHALSRLLSEHGLADTDLFKSRDELIEEAYSRRGQQIAYADITASEEPVVKSTRAVSLYTIGFTKTTAESFFSRLAKAGVRKIVDVRLNNVSQLAGFAKKKDLPYFLKEICNIGYEHRPELAPTQDMLDTYKKQHGDWETYEERFLELMAKRKIEETIPRSAMDEVCLLCSEDKPHHCHRRLVAEYLDQEWGKVDIAHL